MSIVQPGWPAPQPSELAWLALIDLPPSPALSEQERARIRLIQRAATDDRTLARCDALLAT